MKYIKYSLPTLSLAALLPGSDIHSADLFQSYVRWFTSVISLLMVAAIPCSQFSAAKDELLLDFILLNTNNHWLTGGFSNVLRIFDDTETAYNYASLQNIINMRFTLTGDASLTKYGWRTAPFLADEVLKKWDNSDEAWQ